MNHQRVLVSIIAVLLCAPMVAKAVGYASGVSQTGSNVSFVLNQDNSTVQVVIDGGSSTLDLGVLGKGTHSFALPGPGSSYQIRVRTTEPLGWTQISTDNTDTSFYVALGATVNRNPASSHFGSIYVSNATAGTTAFGRACIDGLYRLRADTTTVNSGTAGVTWGGTSGPFKSAVGSDDRLYVTDYSNDLLYDVAADLSSAVQLIDASNRTENQWVAAVIVEGTQAAGNRRICLVDSNYNDSSRKGLIRYNLGAAAAVASGDTGTQCIGPSYYTFYPFDMVRDSQGDWYGTQNRYDSSQAEAVAKFLDGPLPINTAAWQTPPTGPGGEVFNGGYCLDLYEEEGWVAYGNYYDGFVHIFDMDDGSYVGGFDAGSRVRDIAFDAAGNIYTVDNLSEWLKVWSPGGDWLAITGSDGTFVRVPEPVTLSLLVLAGLALIRRRRAA